MTADDNSLIGPSVFDTTEAAAPAAPDEASGEGGGANPAPAPAGKPIFKGIQRDIHTAEELSEYALQLERQTLEQQARLNGLSAASPQTSQSPAASAVAGLDYKQLGEEFILNPGEAVEKIISRVRQDVLGTVDQEISRKEFYRSFYELNEDLVGAEDLVELSVGKNSKAWEKVPTDQAAKLLAADVRARLTKIRGSLPGATQLSSKPAHSLPSGGIPAPKAAAPAPVKLSFAEQLKSLQRKKRA